MHDAPTHSFKGPLEIISLIGTKDIQTDSRLYSFSQALHILCVTLCLLVLRLQKQSPILWTGVFKKKLTALYNIF
jgi:hypothetical protein